MASEAATEKLSTERVAYETTFAIDPSPSKRYLLHNRTPKQIRVTVPDHGELVVPPLGQRVIAGARLAPFAEALCLPRQRHQLRVRRYSPPRRGFRLAAAAIWLSVAVLLGIAIYDVLTVGTLERREVLISAVVSAGLVVLTLAVSGVLELLRREDENLADTEEGDIEFGVGGVFYDGNETVRKVKHIFTLLVVILIGAVLPAIAIIVASDAKDFLTMRGGLDVVDGQESRLVGRVIQITYTSVLSLFPAILYFQFDRNRVGTIRAEWVRAIFRMDRRMQTLADVNARYGDELSEASSYSTDSVRLLGGRNSPIIVATVLISLGWTLLVVNTQSFDFAGSTEVAAMARSAELAAERADEALEDVRSGELDEAVGAAIASAARAQADRASQAAAELAGRATEENGTTVPPDEAPATAEPGADSITGDVAAATAAADRAASAAGTIDQPFFQFLVPTPTAATMAFLGAYFFGIYLLLRSYFRGDLRPKIYNQITARLVTVVVLAYLINTLFYDVGGGPNRFVWMLSFLAGVVPITVLQQLGQIASSIAGPLRTQKEGVRAAFAAAFATPRALTQIDGIDIHDSTRLETEGITDIPSLAKSDLVAVMMKTRLPVERLVDWTDQAVLILLLDDGGNERLDARVEGLRGIGIRTATAVLAADDGRLGVEARKKAKEIVSAAVATGDRGGDGATAGSQVGVATTLASLAAAIRMEPAVERILEWRESEHANPRGDCPTIEVPEAPTASAEASPATVPAHPNGDAAVGDPVVVNPRP